MKKIEPAAKNMRFMVVLDAEALPGVHAPEALLQLLKNVLLHQSHPGFCHVRRTDS